MQSQKIRLASSLFKIVCDPRGFGPLSVKRGILSGTRAPSGLRNTTESPVP